MVDPARHAAQNISDLQPIKEGKDASRSIRLTCFANGECLTPQVALLNGVMFFVSTIAFLVMTIINALRRKKAISSFVGLPLKGCPVINGGIEWALWIPGTSSS